jgi:hypothetical protein
MKGVVLVIESRFLWIDFFYEMRFDGRRLVLKEDSL